MYLSFQVQKWHSREEKGCFVYWSVLEHGWTRLQCAFARDFSKKLPTVMQIWIWHKNFKAEGCLCGTKGCRRPLKAEEIVERVRQKRLRSPRKSIWRTSLETQIPPTTVWSRPEETLVNKTLQVAALSDHNKKGKQTILHWYARQTWRNWVFSNCGHLSCEWQS